MLSSTPVVKAFIEDAGYTGDDLDHPEQTNMFLGCLVIPAAQAPHLWRQTGEAWELAGELTQNDPERVELKGQQLYGSRGPFEEVDLQDSLKIIDLLVGAIIEQDVHLFWEGIPKDRWRNKLVSMNLNSRQVPLLKTALFGFINVLYQTLDLLYPTGHFRIVGDENDWVGAGKLLQPPRKHPWPRLLDGGVVFESSARIRGLQLADVLIHTLYRANKTSCPPPGKSPMLSRTDQIACAFLAKLEENRVVHPLTQVLKELSAKNGRSETEEHESP